MIAYTWLNGQTREFEKRPLDFDKELTSIAFGSCNNQKKDQTIWPYIAHDEPDLWIWSGDIIYADTEDMRVKAAEYQKQKINPAYQRFMAQVPILGIYDDHDYGVNDACKTYPKKVESCALLLDFLDVPKDNPAHKRNGAYQSYSFGPEGKRVKIIILDTRYNRDTLAANPKGVGAKYLPNRTGDVLGFDQWKWFEKQLSKSDADVHVIISSIQVIPKEHDFEKWANFPAARHKFFKTIRKANPANPIIVSGDRHIAEISMMEVEDLDYPLYEVTSSGMTHTWKEYRVEPNQFRVGDLMNKLNYGIIRIDWSGEKPALTAEIKGVGSELLQECQID